MQYDARHLELIRDSGLEQPYAIAVTGNDGIFRYPIEVKSGTISSSETWGPGLVIVNGDISVDEGAELTIAAPCTVLVTYSYDRMQSGQSSVLSEINVYGALSAHGSPAQPIVFTTSRTQDPHTGDWYGIIFSANSSGEMEYCTIAYSSYGVYMRNLSDVNLANCELEAISTTGIYNYMGKLSATGCRFENIKTYGIYSDHAESFIDECEFFLCKSYGIYSYYEAGGSLDSTIITNNSILADNAILANSQYGIRSFEINKIRIQHNEIGRYEQGGIYLYESDAKLIENDIHDAKYYGLYLSYSNGQIKDGTFSDINRISGASGIYVQKNSNPKIRHNEFATVLSGVRIDNTSQPDIGYDYSTAEWGLNDFEGCEIYFIYQAGSPPLPLIKAEFNYFCRPPQIPNRNKFVGYIDYIPYLTSDPFPKAISDGGPIPEVYNLSANFPNPFNPTTTISYSLADPGYTVIEIYNVLGQRVTSLVNEYQEAGEHAVMWNGCNASGNMVSSGVYFYRIASDDFVDTKKMLLLR